MDKVVTNANKVAPSGEITLIPTLLNLCPFYNPIPNLPQISLHVERPLFRSEPGK